MKVLLMVVGNPDSWSTWSGTPKSIKTALERLGCDVSCVDSSVPKRSLVRMLWALFRIITLRRPYGFQYSRLYYYWFFERELRRMDWAGDMILSLNTHLPHPDFPMPCGKQLVVYDDSSILQLVEDKNYYWSSITINDLDVFRLEKINLRRADRVIGMSEAATNFFRKRINVRIARTIRGGANIDMVQLTNWLRLNESRHADYRSAALGEKSIRLCLIATDPVFKGIEEAIAVVEQLESLGYDASIQLIGGTYDHPKVVQHGFIDKRENLTSFLEVVSSCHYGWLYPKFEAFGITVLEFHACALPVVGLNRFGPMTTLESDVDLLMESEESMKSVAYRLIQDVQFDYDAKIARLRGRFEKYSWEYALRELLQMPGHESENNYGDTDSISKP